MADFIVQDAPSLSSDPTITHYELTYDITDAGATPLPPVVVLTTGTAITFTVPEGATVVSTQVDINAAGVRSAPSDPFTLVVTPAVVVPKPAPPVLTIVGPAPVAPVVPPAPAPAP